MYLPTHTVSICLDSNFNFKIFQIDGVVWGLPVQLDHVAILHSGSLTYVVVDTGLVVIYGGPDLIQVAIPASDRQLCGLCGNISAVAAKEKLDLNGKLTSGFSTFVSAWSHLSPPRTSNCNSTRAAEFASDNVCGIMLSSAGPFSGCHSTVHPEPFFQNCVNDLCMSNGNEDLFCSSLKEYTFACQDKEAQVKPWRSEKCREYL